MNRTVYIATGKWRNGRLIEDTDKKRAVSGEDTATAGLVITPEPGGEWKVTHEASGYAATKALPKQVARLVAGAMGGMGIDWTTNRLAINSVVRNLPSECSVWLRSNLQKEGN